MDFSRKPEDDADVADVTDLVELDTTSLSNVTGGYNEDEDEEDEYDDEIVVDGSYDDDDDDDWGDDWEFDWDDNYGDEDNDDEEGDESGDSGDGGDQVEAQPPGEGNLSIDPNFTLRDANGNELPYSGIDPETGFKEYTGPDNDGDGVADYIEGALIYDDEGALVGSVTSDGEVYIDPTDNLDPPDAEV